MNLELRIKELENQIKILSGGFLIIQKALRQGANVVRQDTNEIVKDVDMNILNAVNKRGKGLLIVQDNLSVYIEKLDFFKQLKDVTDKLEEFTSLNFEVPIPPNSVPVWAPQAKKIGIELKALLLQLQEALP